MGQASRRSDGAGPGAGERPRRPRAEEVRFRKEAERLREEAARSRNGASRALVGYYSFLRSVEIGGKWQKWGYSRFDDVVRSVEADLAEYRSFLKCLDAIGSEDTIREIGVEAADIVSGIPSSVNSRTDETVNARDAAIAEVLTLARRHGTTPSRQMAWEVRKKHYKREVSEESPSARYQGRIKELEADKRKLEAKVRRLEQENAAEKQLGRSNDGPLAERVWENVPSCLSATVCCKACEGASFLRPLARPLRGARREVAKPAKGLRSFDGNNAAWVCKCGRLQSLRRGFVPSTSCPA